MRLSRVVALLILIFGSQNVRAYGQVVATWTGTTGNWSNAADWSTFTVPNNSSSNHYRITINAPGSAVTMDVLNDSVDRLTLAATNHLSISVDDNLSLVSGTSSNYGAMVIYGTLTSASVLNNASTGSIVNGGKIINSGNLKNSGFIENYYAELTNNNVFTNNADIDEYHGSIANYGTFTNSARISLDQGGGLVNYGTFRNSGTISDVSEGTDPPNYITNEGLLINTSVGQVNGVAELLNQGRFINNGTYSTGCNVNGYCGATNSGTLINNGTFTNNYAPFEGANAGCNSTQPAIIGCVFTNNGRLINNGTFDNFGTFSSSGSFTNHGTLLDGGVLAGAFNNTGTLTNSGAVTVTNSSSLTTSSDYTQTTGRTIVDGALTATGGAIVRILGGTLSGSGTINGNVVVGGTLMPGDDPGTLTIFGNYEQTGAGMFDELISPYSRAFLDVSGNVVLQPGAALEITLLDGFNPLGSTVSIMDFSSFSGRFANGWSFWDDGYLWDITYRQHEVDVTAVQAPEPSSLLLLGFGALALGALARPRKVTK